jgi:hypothetical protein
LEVGITPECSGITAPSPRAVSLLTPLVPGTRGTVAGIMSWDRLNALLGMTGSVKWVISRTVDNKRSSKT